MAGKKSHDASYQLRLPRSLLQRTMRCAEAAGYSLPEFIRQAMRSKCDEVDHFAAERRSA